MEFYYSKKRIFNTFIIRLLLFVTFTSPIILFFSYTFKDEGVEMILLFSLFFLVPASMVLAFLLLRSLYFLIMPNRLIVTVNKEGISLYTNKKYKATGVIKWSEISYIKESTDNMNRPAIRITLKGHIHGQYLFYFSSKDAKKTEHSVEEVLELMNSHMLSK